MKKNKENIVYWEKELAKMEKKKKSPGNGWLKIVIKKKIEELKEAA